MDELLSELNLCRLTNVLVKRYGQRAGLEAAGRAGAMLEAGDIEGQRVWQRILMAVDELRRDKPGQGETIQ